MKQDACAYDARNVGIVRVGVAHAAVAVDILREAAAWASARGIEVWKDAELPEADFLTAAKLGQLFMGFEGTLPVATMLLQPSDSVYWPEVPAGSSLYLHKVAVRRCAAGQGWLARLVQFAVDDARAHAIRWLRMDTLFQSPLQGLYEHLGFKRVEEQPLTIKGRRMIRMERALCP